MCAADLNDRTVVQRHDPLVGTLLDQRFRIDFQLAAGGFGAIYRATDMLTDAEVALKVLHAQLARDSRVVARFRREGATLQTLRDPHTITAYELGEAPDGTLYIVLELLRGESLYEQFRARGPLPWRRVVHIARGVCSSLAEAHAAGIVHRDLKPANIHLESVGGDPDFAKVLDFGIAKILQGGDERSDLTQTGQMVGTIDYMSPEQMAGGELTGRSDIYTLGVVMYEMISGKTPFGGPTATAVLAAVLTQTAEPLSRRAEVPPLLEQIVARCLEREAENRFADITELADALARVAATRSAASTPARPAVAVAGAAAQAPRRDLPRDPAVPSTGFEPVVTAAATRIDVRYRESSQPVPDVRGAREQRYWPAAADAGPTEPMFDVRSGATPAPAVAIGSAGVAAPPMGPSTVPRMMPGWTAGAPMALATPLPFVPPPGFATPVPPSASPARYPVRSYDMTAAATRDTMVRRLIWIAVLAIALIAFLIVK